MKRLLLSLSMSLLTIGAFAQLDLAVTSISSPANGTTVTTNSAFPVTFYVTNTGTTTLNPNDTIYYRIEIDGGIISVGGGQNIFPVLVTSTLAPGDSVQITTGSYSIDFWNFSGGSLANKASFTYGINVRGTTCCPSLDDADVSNNLKTITLNNGSLGVDEIVEASTVSSYYANGLLNIESANNNETLNVSVFNMAGQEVKTAVINTKGEVSVSELPNGVYISKITVNGKVESTMKFVK